MVGDSLCRLRPILTPKIKHVHLLLLTDANADDADDNAGRHSRLQPLGRHIANKA